MEHIVVCLTIAGSAVTVAAGTVMGIGYSFIHALERNHRIGASG
jgi:hypothetical protein